MLLGTRITDKDPTKQQQHRLAKEPNTHTFARGARARSKHLLGDALLTLLSGSSYDLSVAHAQLVRLPLSQHLLKAPKRDIENEHLLKEGPDRQNMAGRPVRTKMAATRVRWASREQSAQQPSTQDKTRQETGVLCRLPRCNDHS